MTRPNSLQVLLDLAETILNEAPDGASEWFDIPLDDIRRARGAALSAALSIEQTEPVKVKALEWIDGPPGTYKEIAESPFGHYSVWEINGTACWSPWKAGSGAIVDGGIAAAKAAAQQDYETRVRSALVNAQADADVVERLKEALKGAAEELDRISCVPRVTETSDTYDQFERAKFFADRGASAAWATVRSLRPAEVGSATTSKGISE